MQLQRHPNSKIKYGILFKTMQQLSISILCSYLVWLCRANFPQFRKRVFAWQKMPVFLAQILHGNRNALQICQRLHFIDATMHLLNAAIRSFSL